jgi:ATP-dependent exoDNAse (exonuclease V) beta subunit
MAGRVALLLAGGHKPREVAALTFTELAAAELAHRIRSTVEALLRDEIPKVLDPALPSGLSLKQKTALVSAAAELDELTTTTLHGFCQTIVLSHAVAAQLDPGSKVIDAPAADAMFESVFFRWLTERLSGVAAIPDDAIAVLSRDKPLKLSPCSGNWRN